MSAIRATYRKRGYSASSIDIILKSWRKSTLDQYCIYAKAWFEFSCNGLRPNVRNLIEFLTHLHTKGYSHDQLCTARSAVGALSHISNIGKHPDVKRFFKGLFEMAPVLPRVVSVWNVTRVFDYLRKLPHQNELSLQLCGKKLAILICLLAGGQRSQTVHAIKATDIKVTSEKCFIPIYDPLKQTRRGKHIKPLEFKVYTKEPKLCVVSNLSAYFEKTRSIRSSSPLFISYIKPHKAVSKDTIARWCRDIMEKSGIDITKYTTHSCRSAASSMASTRNVELKKILEACGWSTEQSFAFHYQKTITPDIGDVLVQ